MHDYKSGDLTACLKDSRVVFVGDSATRQIFWAFAKKLGFQDGGGDRHRDISLSARGVAIDFFWDPYVNSSSLQSEVTLASLSNEGSRTNNTTAILMIGGGLWHARYLDDLYLSKFEDSFHDIAEIIGIQDENDLNPNGSLSEDRVISRNSLAVIAPVQIPMYAALRPSRASSMTPDRIDTLNGHLMQLSWGRQIPVVRSFALMTAWHGGAYDPDGLHVIPEIAASRANVLLNIRCNTALRNAQSKTYPMDKTCCTRYQSINWTQAIILNTSMGLLPLFILITFKDTKRLAFLPSRKITHAITTLALAMCYCFYADRTHLFTKAQKQYDDKDFLVLLSLILLVGILSIHRSAASPHNKSHSPKYEGRDQPFLSRHQTDEWKGWMQLIILVYHYTGASKVLWIYQIIRLLVASYLFMSGFGHTVFFYKRADYSLHRCAAVLIRLNMLSCILPYVMKTDYAFYYFAPLISFWYLVTYATMALGRSKNHNLTFLVTKIGVSAIIVTVMIRLQNVFDIIFYLLAKSCNVHWDVKEWRFRLQLDSYVVYSGMLCGIFFVRATDILCQERREKTKHEAIIRHYLNQARLVLGIFAVLGLPLYFAAASRALSKQAYNSWLPYVSTFPILSFIVLRNLTKQMRNFHSSIFVWVGRHSLETFTLQFHIWLAADTKGLLALGVVEKATRHTYDGRKFDTAVLTIIFLWVCWHVADATQTLTSWMIDPRAGREDIDVEREADHEGRNLLRNKNDEAVLEIFDVSSAAKGVGTRALNSASKFKKLIAGDLKIRLAIIVGTLWILNVVSVSSTILFFCRRVPLTYHQTYPKR